MKKSSGFIIQAVLFTAVGALTCILLLYLYLVPNVEMFEARDVSGYRTIDSVAYSEAQDDNGLVRQFRFTLDDEIAYDTTLIFHFNHQNAVVYLDGEMVYSLHAAKEMRIVRTIGGQWAMIPLFREDVGKEVLVELRPVYADYQNQNIEFLIGSKLSVYVDELINSLPEIILCFDDVFAGLILLMVAAYFSFKKRPNSGFHSLGILAIALGLWNFTQTNFSALLSPTKTTFMYYISITMLAISVFALIKCAEVPRRKNSSRIWKIGTLVYSVLIIVWLALQLRGILDLRQTLSFIHAALIVSAFAMIVNSIRDNWQKHRKTGTKGRFDPIWMLGVGVLLDLVNYYTGIVTAKLMFVLLAVFIYVLLCGFYMFTAYFRQSKQLEEKETQLTMSRVTTMMSQIRSHFVFNVLNAISGMCKYDPEKADDTVVRFARYLRNNIDVMENDQNVPFLQEMERLEDYIVLEQVRFGDRIEFTTDLQVDRFEIPPLILQPIVGNAIKHGISKRKEGGNILLRTRDTGENIEITVTDNGVGFPMEELNKETSVGLRNIRFRLHHLMGGSMDIKSQLGIGTIVTLTIPKEEHYEPDLCR